MVAGVPKTPASLIAVVTIAVVHVRAVEQDYLTGACSFMEKTREGAG